MKEGINVFADYHVHTEFSEDSFYEMEKVVKDAIKLGIKEICFTDHVEYGITPDVTDDVELAIGANGKLRQNVNYPKYFEKINYLQTKYKDQIVIKKGLEFGIQMHTINKYQELVKKWPMDFIILSIHEIDNQEFWLQDYQRNKTQKEYNDGYYQALYNVITNYNDYSVLGHLDIIKRYDQQGIYPFENNKEIITKILKHVIDNEKGIELNTSSFRYGLKDLTPCKDILKLYHDLGGQIITIGSDSHAKEHLGVKIKECKKELRKIGFTKFCTFENMKPIFHDL